MVTCLLTLYYWYNFKALVINVSMGYTHENSGFHDFSCIYLKHDFPLVQNPPHGDKKLRKNTIYSDQLYNNHYRLPQRLTIG